MLPVVASVELLLLAPPPEVFGDVVVLVLAPLEPVALEVVALLAVVAALVLPVVDGPPVVRLLEPDDVVVGLCEAGGSAHATQQRLAKPRTFVLLNMLIFHV